jgi:hypothetical protein
MVSSDERQGVEKETQPLGNFCTVFMLKLLLGDFIASIPDVASAMNIFS